MTVEKKTYYNHFKLVFVKIRREYKVRYVHKFYLILQFYLLKKKKYAMCIWATFTFRNFIL